MTLGGVRKDHDPEQPDFEAYFRVQYPRIVASLSLVVGSRELAEDSAAEAFARTFARWTKVRAYSSPVGWTYRVALNVAKRQMRRRGHEAHLLFKFRIEESRDAVPQMDVWSQILKLPERQRIAVVLRYGDDLTEAEIGNVMGTSRSAVSSALASAKRSLAGLLEDANLDEGPAAPERCHSEGVNVETQGSAPGSGSPVRK